MPIFLSYSRVVVLGLPGWPFAAELEAPEECRTESNRKSRISVNLVNFAERQNRN